MPNNLQESPDYVQTSMAGALSLGLRDGNFFRNAKLFCLNILLTYKDGCRANCAFCGLGHARKYGGSSQEKTFIRVDWPIVKTSEIIERLKSPSLGYIRRVCISMITHKRAKEDTLVIADMLENTMKQVSVLLSPTNLNRRWLEELKKTTVDKVGIAIDASTPALFDKLRGKGVKGPHSWNKYWKTISDAIEIFGSSHTGIHLVIGVGETEKEAIELMQKIHDAGSDTHLFSFFPEPGSAMEHEPQPGIGTYRRIQLAREAIHRDLTTLNRMSFNESGQVVDFGMMEKAQSMLIDDGIAFMTQGCKDDADGFITCNRPYSNCTPFQAAKGELRNFPFKPEREDLLLIKKQLRDYDRDSWVRTLEKAEDFILEDS
ncbi:MAG: radical SAM protein [Promethearchaeota archaeon]